MSSFGSFFNFYTVGEQNRKLSSRSETIRKRRTSDSDVQSCPGQSLCPIARKTEVNNVVALRSSCGPQQPHRSPNLPTSSPCKSLLIDFTRTRPRDTSSRRHHLKKSESSSELRLRDCGKAQPPEIWFTDHAKDDLTSLASLSISSMTISDHFLSFKDTSRVPSECQCKGSETNYLP